MESSRRSCMLGFAVVVCMFAQNVSAFAQTINVEVDWLKAAGHDHKPNACELDAVKAAFLRHGIGLNIEMSTEINETAALETIDLVTPNEFDSGEWATLEDENRDHAAGSGWHYIVFGHNYSLNAVFTTSSGRAEISGDEALVSLGSFDSSVGTPWDRAGTFMHEFGHNLGLRHAGDQNESTVKQYKPNYASVMAYRYQLTGVKNGLQCQGLTSFPAPVFHLDFSEGRFFPDLDENALVEAAGIGYGEVDWDCSGGIGGTSAKDVSSNKDWCIPGGFRTCLADYDDWANVVSVAKSAERLSSETEVVSCTTPEELPKSILACPQVDPCSVDQECGDNVIDSGEGEVCDGTNLGGLFCADLGYVGGVLGCKPTCHEFDTSSCFSVCDDGMIHAGEVCDGMNLGGASCMSLGFTGGSLNCDAGCAAFDASGCTSVCGDNLVSPDEVCDGPDLKCQNCADLGFYGGTLACNSTCDGLDTTACGFGPGEVPPNITMARTPGGIVINWFQSTCIGADFYAIYEGDLRSWYSHTLLRCSADPSSEVITPGPDDHYYLVVPYNSQGEGSYGRDFSGNERPPGSPACVVPQLLECL